MPRLSNCGIPTLTPEVLNNLSKCNVRTVQRFLELESEQIAKLSSLHYQQVLKVKEALLLKNASILRSGVKYLEETSTQHTIIPSGIEKFDQLLHGGFLTGYIYELCGVSPSGKSQVCMTTTANLVSKTNRKVFYIDTKGDFSAGRVVTILKNLGKNGDEDIMNCLKLIEVCRPNSPFELLSALHDYSRRPQKDAVSLLIIDSLPAVFNQGSGSINNNENIRLLSNLASVLQFIAFELQSAVLVTNMLFRWNEEERSALGKFWADVPETRISITEHSTVKVPQFKFSIQKSFSLKTNTSTILSLTENGIM